MRGVVAAVFLFALLMTVAYAVTISLSSNDVAQLGGTGLVDVYCPANPCQITKVSWVLTSSPPFQVDQVNVQWQTAKTVGASYTVYVVLYDNTNSVISSGSATQPASALPVTTLVDVVANVSPASVYRVEVIIVEN
ncbi:MAG: hypothetical protein QXO86_02795 [Nitrososphaerota archaeon]